VNNQGNISVLKRLPFRWLFYVFLKNDLNKTLGEPRFIQAETKEEAMEIARRFNWLKEVEESIPPNELSYFLVPDFEKDRK
tara:strand:- start:65 stop:307 length:243 start_codon:yes stop_codon:yes gene_type:complete